MSASTSASAAAASAAVAQPVPGTSASRRPASKCCRTSAFNLRMHAPASRHVMSALQRNQKTFQSSGDLKQC